MKAGSFEKAISQSRKIGLDTSILIYHFEAVDKYTAFTSLIFSAVAGGVGAILPSIAVTELLVKPFRTAPAGALEGLINQLRNMPNFNYVGLSFDAAVQAARIRAKHGLAAPDALNLAACLDSGADIFITNDTDFRKVDGKEKIKIAILEDYIG